MATPGRRRPGACAPARSAGRRRSSAARSCSAPGRAGHGAVGAADAQVVVDGDNAVGALLRRGARAHLHAGRLVAVLAADRHEGALHVGYSPTSMSITRRHCTPGGVALACLQAAVQVWQPTQRRRSATMAQRVMCGLLRRAACLCSPSPAPGRRPSRWRRSGRATSRPAYSGWARRSPWPAA